VLTGRVTDGANSCVGCCWWSMGPTVLVGSRTVGCDSGIGVIEDGKVAELLKGVCVCECSVTTSVTIDNAYLA